MNTLKISDNTLSRIVNVLVVSILDDKDRRKVVRPIQGHTRFEVAAWRQLWREAAPELRADMAATLRHFRLHDQSYSRSYDQYLAREKARSSRKPAGGRRKQLAHC